MKRGIVSFKDDLDEIEMELGVVEDKKAKTEDQEGGEKE